MPDIDGLGLASMVRADPGIPLPTFVLLTSRGERLQPAQMEEHGLAACELKPVHPDKLRYTLARVMAASRPPIPFAVPVPATPPVAPAAGDPLILVAEDNIVNQKVTLLQLRKLGYTADIVPNGRDAVTAVRSKPYSLVLMDAQMPELDGIAATREIRAAQAAGLPGFPRELRIIAMTANAMVGDREACLEAGMDDYLSKPVRPEDLRTVLERHLPRETVTVGSTSPCGLAK
jgi:two-component system sensor histidine kinase/response regulator